MEAEGSTVTIGKHSVTVLLKTILWVKGVEQYIPLAGWGNYLSVSPCSPDVTKEEKREKDI